MNKYLPKTKTNTSGFTMVELLVVISVIAILVVIGITLFSGVQTRARDSRRKSDIMAMGKAMEVNYKPGTGYTTPLAGSWFSDGTIPVNPGPGGATYYTNSPSTAGYTFCASLEDTAGGNSSVSNAISGSTGQYFCKKNEQ